MTFEAIQEIPPSGRSRDKRFKGVALDNLRERIEAFICGDEFEEGFDLRRLTPPEAAVWEIKGFGRDRLRLFGWFAAFDCFIGSHAERRSNYGAIDDPAWDNEIQKCVRKRDGQFADLPVFSCPRFRDHGTRLIEREPWQQ